MVNRGQVVVVTGAAGGIGSAITTAIGDRGAIAVLACHPSTLDDGAALAAATPNASAHAVDVADRESVLRFARTIAAEFGSIDGLVNNAGVLAEVAFDDLDEELWAHVLGVNLTGTFRMIHALRRPLAADGGGSIVNIASQLAYTGAPNVAPYAASKGGILGLTRALAHDLAPRVRVNAVAPGPIESPMNTPYMADQAWVDRKVGKSVQRRFGTGAEVAAAVTFLLSPDSSYFTGQTLSPNGGGVMP